jgi:menaquinone-specific isochorismate synthase
MPVTPYRANLLQDHKELYQLLSASKQRAIEKDCPQILSISQEIQPLDPLAVLQAIAKPNHLQFYLEKGSKNESIAAIDAIDFIKIEGINRFKQSSIFYPKLS